MMKINKTLLRVIAVICALAMLGTIVYSIVLGFLGYL